MHILKCKASVGDIGLKREGKLNTPIPQSRHIGAGANTIPSMGAIDLRKRKPQLGNQGSCGRYWTCSEPLPSLKSGEITVQRGYLFENLSPL